MRTLDDCANPAVLRAQVSPPAAETRDRILALQRQSRRIEIDAWVAGRQRQTARVVELVQRLVPIGDELQTLHPSSAAPTVLGRAQMLATIAWDVDARRRVDARNALDEAIARFELCASNGMPSSTATTILRSITGAGDASTGSS